MYIVHTYASWLLQNGSLHSQFVSHICSFLLFMVIVTITFTQKATSFCPADFTSQQS